MTPQQLESQLVRDDLRTWFEMHGCILDKKRKATRAPDLKCNQLQDELGEIIRVCRRDRIPCRVVTLKGRQQGSSTISVAAAVHELRRRSAKCCIIGDQFEKSVKNLVTMFHDYCAEDKFAWGNKFTPKAMGGAFSHGSLLGVETANDPRAGASGTIQVLIATEVAHWPETTVISARAVFAALLNCVPEEPDTIVIVESTPNGAGGVYYDTYAGAMTLAEYLERKASGRPMPENWNGYFKVSYFWWQHPEYDLPVSAEQEAEILATLSDRELEFREELNLPVSRLAWRRKVLKSPRFNGDEEKFEEEYPGDEVRCFLLSGRRAFPLVMVQKLKKEARLGEPVRHCVLQWTHEGQKIAGHRLCSEDDAMLRVWELPRPGFRYLLPVDPMTGASQTTGADPDNHGAGVIRCGYFREGAWHPPMLVARLADVYAEKRDKRIRAVCRWDIDVLERQVAMLSCWYGRATIVPEMNMDRGLVELLKVRGGMNIYLRRAFNRVRQKEEEMLGWMTTAATRGPIIENLKRAVRMQGEPGEGIVVKDMAVIGELETMVVMANGKEEAMGGCKDDNVMMLAIGMANLDCARVMPYPARRGRQFDDDYEPERRDYGCT